MCRNKGQKQFEKKINKKQNENEAIYLNIL